MEMSGYSGAKTRSVTNGSLVQPEMWLRLFLGGLDQPSHRLVDQDPSGILEKGI
jgi:hypothetical protein